MVTESKIPTISGFEIVQVSVNRHQATVAGNKKNRILKRVIPTNEVRRELVINEDYQRFGIQIIPINEVRSLPLSWQGLNKFCLLPISRTLYIILNTHTHQEP